MHVNIHIDRKWWRNYVTLCIQTKWTEKKKRNRTTNKIEMQHGISPQGIGRFVEEQHMDKHKKKKKTHLVKHYAYCMFVREITQKER